MRKMPRGREKRQFYRKVEKKVCVFCSDDKRVIDYKNVDELKKFVSNTGKMSPKRATGNCAKHQRKLTIAIKRARHLALLPYFIKGEQEARFKPRYRKG